MPSINASPWKAPRTLSGLIGTRCYIYMCPLHSWLENERKWWSQRFDALQPINIRMEIIIPKSRNLLSVSNFRQKSKGIACSGLHRFLLRGLSHGCGSYVPIHREDTAPRFLRRCVIVLLRETLDHKRFRIALGQLVKLSDCRRLNSWDRGCFSRPYLLCSCEKGKRGTIP